MNDPCDDYEILLDCLYSDLVDEGVINETDSDHEQYPYRFVQCGTIEINGLPDYRIQKFNEWKKRYFDMYLLDNSDAT